MNRTQMIEALKEGYMVSHESFSNDEHIYMKDSIIFDENDYNMRGLSGEFMTIRSGEGWEDGWFVKDPTVLDMASDSYLSKLIEFTRNDIYDMSSLMMSDRVKVKYSGRFEPIRTEPKINRNSICNCGSGLKYKKCCINK